MRLVKFARFEDEVRRGLKLDKICRFLEQVADDHDNRTVIDSLLNMRPGACMTLRISSIAGRNPSGQYACVATVCFTLSRFNSEHPHKIF